MSGTKYRVYYGINSEGRFAADIAAAESRCFSEPWSESAVRDFSHIPITVGNFVIPTACFRGISPIRLLPESSRSPTSAYCRNSVAAALRMGLWAAFVAFAKEQKAEKISLEVRASNEPARALYEKWGFKAVGLRRNFYKAPTEDAVLYDKILEQ